MFHLAGTLRPARGDTYESANLETTRAVADAVRDSRVRRVLFLSYPGADESARNPYLRAKAQAERMLRETGKELVVFRCTHIIGPPEAPGPTARSMVAERGKAVPVLGNGRQTVAPLYLGDVVSALVAAATTGAAGTYELAGPQRMSLDELVRLLNREPQARIRHLPTGLARLLGRFAPSLRGPMVDVLLRDSVADPTRAVTEFGLGLTSLRTVWA